jgi:hypothetical protein
LRDRSPFFCQLTRTASLSCPISQFHARDPFPAAHQADARDNSGGGRSRRGHRGQSRVAFHLLLHLQLTAYTPHECALADPATGRQVGRAERPICRFALQRQLLAAHAHHSSKRLAALPHFQATTHHRPPTPRRPRSRRWLVSNGGCHLDCRHCILVRDSRTAGTHTQQEYYNKGLHTTAAGTHKQTTLTHTLQ